MCIQSRYSIERTGKQALKLEGVTLVYRKEYKNSNIIPPDFDYAPLQTFLKNKAALICIVN
jgi:hypothetical protein